ARTPTAAPTGRACSTPAGRPTGRRSPATDRPAGPPASRPAARPAAQPASRPASRPGRIGPAGPMPDSAVADRRAQAGAPLGLRVRAGEPRRLRAPRGGEHGGDRHGVGGRLGRGPRLPSDVTSMYPARRLTRLAVW